MTKKAFQLGFCLLAAAIAAFTTPARAIDFSYSQNGLGKSMALACNDAVQRIAARCTAGYGAITTDPGGCWPIYSAEGVYLFDACTCKATAAFCRIST